MHLKHLPPCYLEEQNLLWRKVLELKARHNEEWYILGNFNAIRDRSECMGCRDRMEQCEELNDMINNGELVDLPLVGKKFTWFGYDNKRSRLGRFLLSPGWLLKFRDICQRGFKHSVSDQCACSIVHWGYGLGPRPFKNFKCWLDDKECLESIKNQWIKNARHNDFGRDLFHKLSSGLKIKNIVGLRRIFYKVGLYYAGVKLVIFLLCNWGCRLL
ncbi:hypothetical protein Gohar_015503, partial [Gossypium harknessii]|nr:hypothetical protein [Gossypium harknessii]